MSATRTKRAPHRHHCGEHVEAELRYLRPDGFEVPDELDGLIRELSAPNPHTDRYYDAPAADETGGMLRAAGCSLRVRVKQTGAVLATFKVKLPDRGAAALRDETEDAVHCGRCGQPASHCACGACDAADAYLTMVTLGRSAALDKARTVAACRPFVHLYTVRNDRTDHHYRLGDSHVVLSEDCITYPDGSVERRVEVEHVAGDPARLARIDRQLRRVHAGLRLAARGKSSEARRRMLALLAA